MVYNIPSNTFLCIEITWRTCENVDSDSVGLRWARDSAFLASSRVMLVARGPQTELCLARISEASEEERELSCQGVLEWISLSWDKLCVPGKVTSLFWALVTSSVKYGQLKVLPYRASWSVWPGREASKGSLVLKCGTMGLERGTLGPHCGDLNFRSYPVVRGEALRVIKRLIWS